MSWQGDRGSVGPCYKEEVSTDRFWARFLGKIAMAFGRWLHTVLSCLVNRSSALVPSGFAPALPPQSYWQFITFWQNIKHPLWMFTHLPLFWIFIIGDLPLNFLPLNFDKRGQVSPLGLRKPLPALSPEAFPNCAGYLGLNRESSCYYRELQVV